MEDAMPLIEIRAGKLCGVFYSSPEPEKPPYVHEGSVITIGAVLGIIDMMKSMNPLVWTPEISGIAEVVWKENNELFVFDGDVTATVCAVHAKNETVVEPGHLLFELEVAREPEISSPAVLERVSIVEEITVGNSQAPKRVEITSLYVGWFHSTPVDAATPYVQIGDTVEAGQVLCRIHALEHDNLIVAPVRGIVRERYEEEGISVDYGRPLFSLELLDT